MPFPNVNPGWAGRALSPQSVSFTAPGQPQAPPPPIGTNRSEILAELLRQPRGPAPLSAGQAIVEGLGKGLEGWAVGNAKDKEKSEKTERGRMMAGLLGVQPGDPRFEPMATLLAEGDWAPSSDIIEDKFGLSPPTEQWTPTEMFGMPGQQSSTTGKFDPFPATTADDNLTATDKPIYNSQTGEWIMPPQPEGGGLFSGTSVEAQSLNYLVNNGVLTPQQAADIGAGKTISGPNGEIIFMTPTGIFSQATPDAQPIPLIPDAETVPAMPDTGGPLATEPQRPGMIPLTTPPPGGNLTPAERVVDSAYAKEYADWTAAGGYADIDKQLEQLDEAARMLESGRDDLTGPIVGGIPEWIAPGVVPEAVSTREAVEEVVQRNLRLILGAQFTQKEGERLIARAYNPMLSEAENAKRVRRLITQIRAAAEAKQAAADYFSQYGTLKGWKGKVPTFADFNPDAETPTAAGGPVNTDAATGTNAPPVGTIDMGDDGTPYRFKGGDPSDPNNWEPVS